MAKLDEDKAKAEEEEEESTEKKDSHKKEKDVKEEIERLREERDHWKNEYYRAYADTQNLRKTLEKDHQEAIRYRAEGFIEGLLPILDSFYLVLASSPQNPEIKNYVEGFSYIYKNLVNVLENEGVKEIAPEVGEKFNPTTMAAIETCPGEKENIVEKVYSRGYYLHDRVIRPATVMVSLVPKPKELETNDSSEETK
ncbi:MAG: nucleotide exchange factor GrpE [Coprobacillus sp.]|nr:nucleotide exchange factor GrpE [Coprobacillus sp.]